MPEPRSTKAEETKAAKEEGVKTDPLGRPETHDDYDEDATSDNEDEVRG
jgi:hypothetical protein